MTVAILAHYSRTLGHGIDWNMDEGVIYHAGNEHGTATLCGYRSDAPQRGTSDRGWEFWGTDRRFIVTCQRCLRILEQGGHDHEMSQAQLLRAARRRDLRIREAFDRLRDYLGEALRKYRPAGVVEEPEYKAWQHIFAECAYELLRGTPTYKGFADFTETDWSRVESGTLSRTHHEYWLPLSSLLKKSMAHSR